MKRRRFAVILLLLVAAAAVWWADARAQRGERSVRVELSCHGDRCEARIDGGEPLIQEIPAARRARRLGLYTYHPWDATTETGFRNLRIERVSGLRPYDLTLTDLDHAGWFENDRADAWTLREGVGLVHLGAAGSRGIALIAPPTENDFDLGVELDDPADAGVAFRGYDAENTWIFVVRSAHNDAFFVRVHRGEPQGVSAIMPLRALTPGREALRLAGLAGRIVLVSGLALLALSLLSAAVARWPSKVRAWTLEVRADRVRIIAVCLFVATVVTCGSVSTVWLQRIPHIEDESAYLFQARVFAAGELWAPPPANPQFFEHEHLILQQDRWFSKYPPLFSALLALGVLAGVPWLVNPFLAALTGWVVYRLARELVGPVWGLIAWALLLVSPFFVVMGSTFMSHMAAALLTALFLLCSFRAVRVESTRLWFAAGLFLGLAFLTRPFTAALVGLAVAPFMLVHWIRRWRAPAMLALGVVPGIVVFLAWGALHSAPGALSFNAYAQNESSDTLGFGPDKGATWMPTWGDRGHTPAKAFRASHNYLDYTSRHQFGWPLRLSFVFVLAGLCWHRRRGEAWMLALIPVMLALGHGFYWATQHVLYGARYWFAGVPAIALLTVLGLRALAEKPAARPLLAALVIACVSYNVVAYMPTRLRELPQYGGISADLARAVDRAGIEGAIVFVRIPGLHFNDGFHLNDPTDPTATLFAVDLGVANRSLLRQYPAREAWQWNGERLLPLDSRVEARR